MTMTKRPMRAGSTITPMHDFGPAMTGNGMARPCSSPASRRSWPQQSSLYSTMMPRSLWLRQQMQLNQLKRREVITLLGGAVAWPLAAHAQQGDRMRRIGVLLPASADDTAFHDRIGAFLQGLQESGWSIGR